MQVALSLVLLISAGLFARTVASLEGLDAGFNQRGLVLFRIDATSAGYAEAGFVPLHDRIEARLAALPGVRGVTFSRVALLSRVRLESIHLADRHGAGRASAHRQHQRRRPELLRDAGAAGDPGPRLHRARIARGRRRWRW